MVTQREMRLRMSLSPRRLCSVDLGLRRLRDERGHEAAVLLPQVAKTSLAPIRPRRAGRRYSGTDICRWQTMRSLNSTVRRRFERTRWPEFRQSPD